MLQAYKINIAYKAAENLKQLIDTTECDIKELEKQATSVQNYAKVYTPDEEDIVDKAVANALNEFGKPLSVGFVRVSNGVYLCGDTRIHIGFFNSKLKVTSGNSEYDFNDYIASLHS